MTKEETIGWLDELMAEVVVIEGGEADIRLKLLDLAYRIICKVKELREAIKEE